MGGVDEVNFASWGEARESGVEGGERSMSIMKAKFTEP
jgi:hypothetical protein